MDIIGPYQLREVEINKKVRQKAGSSSHSPKK
jgi:hypothetical protein